MNVAAWDSRLVIALCLAWVVVCAFVSLRPYARALRDLSRFTEQYRTVAVNFSLGGLLLRVALVLVPPGLLLAVYLLARSH